jgi:hypothetical protein
MLFAYPTGPMGNVVSKGVNEHAHQTIVPLPAAKSSAETPKKARSEVRPEAMRREISRPRGYGTTTTTVAQRLSYSSWRRHQTPVSLRPPGARSSHWYMPQRASSPRA